MKILYYWWDTEHVGKAWQFWYQPLGGLWEVLPLLRHQSSGIEFQHPYQTLVVASRSQGISGGSGQQQQCLWQALRIKWQFWLRQRWETATAAAGQKGGGNTTGYRKHEPAEQSRKAQKQEDSEGLLFTVEWERVEPEVVYFNGCDHDGILTPRNSELQNMLKATLNPDIGQGNSHRKISILRNIFLSVFMSLEISIHSAELRYHLQKSPGSGQTYNSLANYCHNNCY